MATVAQRCAAAIIRYPLARSGAVHFLTHSVAHGVDNRRSISRPIRHSRVRTGKLTDVWVAGRPVVSFADGRVADRSSGIRSGIPVADNLDLFLSLLSDGAIWVSEANAPTTRRVSGRSHSRARPHAAMVARLENARLRPKWSIAYPPKVVLNAAPIPTALPTIPSPRLNRPVPRVMSATTRGRTTPRTAALTPSRA